MNTIQKVENAKNSSISVINNVPSGFPSSVVSTIIVHPNHV